MKETTEDDLQASQERGLNLWSQRYDLYYTEEDVCQVKLVIAEKAGRAHKQNLLSELLEIIRRMQDWRCLRYDLRNGKAQKIWNSVAFVVTLVPTYH